MAEVLRSHEFAGRTAKKHDWENWMDGRAWKLTEEDYGDTKPLYIVAQARIQAEKRGKKLRSEVNSKEGYCIIQAVDMTDEEQEAYEEKVARQKARKEERKAESQRNGSTEHEEEEEALAPKKGKGKGKPSRLQA